MGSYFTDDSVLRRVQREYAVALSGPRALLMQAAHPIAFGSRAKADRMTRRVRAMHRRVRGEVDGVPYRADDPELLLWILACLVDSALLVYGRYVGPLSRDERDAYWQDYKVIGRHFGLEDHEMPDTIEDFEQYMQDMLAGDDLFVSDEARELAIDIVMRPPVPLVARPLLELANFITVGLLPERLRAMYGFSWDPARGLALHAGAEYTKRLLVPFLPGFVRHVPRARTAVA